LVWVGMNKATYGRKGISADQPLAVEVGIEILRSGGNAFDAAIAVSAMLTVVHPFSGGIGGDGFLLALRGDEIVAYNGSGRSPSGFNSEEYTRLRPSRGPLTVTIPGLVEMWGYIYEEFCSMDLEHLLRPAISLAENGFYADKMLANAVKRYREDLALYGRWGKLYGDVEVGSLVKNRDLASTLRRIATRGWDEFYYGRLAEEIASELAEQGVGISLEDLVEHEGLEMEPLKLDLGSKILYELPPNSQGVSTLQMISAIYELGLDRYRFEDPERIRAWREPVSSIYGFRDRHLGDPEHMAVDVSSYTTYRSIVSAERIRQDFGDGDTTFFVVDDGDNLVGFIQSLFYPFGSGLVARGAVVQNRGRGFSFEMSLPNSPAPGKRPLHTLSILMVEDHAEGAVYMIGCAGGDYRPQIHARVYENIFVYGMSMGEALGAPRFIYTDLSKASKVLVEGGLSAVGLEGLEVIKIPHQGSTGIVNAAKRYRSKGFTEFAPDPRGASISIAV